MAFGLSVNETYLKLKGSIEKQNGHNKNIRELNSKIWELNTIDFNLSEHFFVVTMITGNVLFIKMSYFNYLVLPFDLKF